MVPSTWLWVSMGDGHGMAWFLSWSERAGIDKPVSSANEATS